METYRLEVHETAAPGIDADVYGKDELIEESTHVAYDDFDVELPDERDAPSPVTEEVTADVVSLDLQIHRDGDGFTVQLLGDRDELATVRIDDDEWSLR